MLKSKLGKKLAAGATALAMVASASAASLSTTLTAFAGMQLGEGTFEEGAGLPWHVCENGTGSMAFSIANGVYSILIKNPGGASNGGEDRWDCQFRHRGLTLEWGHTYRITYSMYTTKSTGAIGNAYAKIGDINNDDLEYWHMNGTPLTMEYKEGMTMSELETALKGASTSGEEIPYYTWGGNWKTSPLKEKSWNTFAYEFTLNKSDPNNTTVPDTIDGTAEWTFHFGGDGQYTEQICFAEGTILKFDNLALIDMTGDTNDYVAEPEKPKSGLVLNQLGFFPNLEKKATLQVAEGTAPVSFTVEGPEPFSGTGSATTFEPAAGEFCQVLDFSSIKTPGEYTLTADGKSVKFTVGDNIYGNLLADSLNYFYLNRSGIPIEEKYIQNAGKNASKAALARDAGHAKDEALVSDEWVFIYTSEPTYSKSIDVTGGWYDAGDYGKYVVNGGVSMWTLASAYERSPEKFADGASFINIPETGNGTPDILDELKWEADFFIKMTREDGMVYHKIHDYKWTALGVMPGKDFYAGEDEKVLNVVAPTRIVKPVTYAATLNSAAALAQLARLLEKAGDPDASKYKDAAIKNYKAAKDAYVAKYGDIYKDAGADASNLNEPFAPLDQNKGGGPYGDTQVTDEFYWAACELYCTTGDSEYYEDLKKYPEAFGVTTNLVGGENQGSPTSFTWGTLQALGTASLAYNQDKLTADEAKAVVQAFQEAGDFYLKVQAENQYGSNYKGCTYQATVTDINGDEASERTVTLDGGYEWGSNSMVVNNAIIEGIAYDLTGDVKYLNGVVEGMDYILGRNPNENSYITGYGTSTTENPHHRYWCHQMKADWPSAPDGCLSGGPNSNMNDPMIQGAGYKIGELAPMKCYYDQVDAWSVNEITINWNSPVVWISSFVEDTKAGDGTTPTPSTPDKPDTPDTPSDEPGEADPSKILWGDANVDGEVDIMDVIAVNKNLLGSGSLSAQGKLNADVDEKNGVDTTDSLNIIKLVVELLTQADMPIK